jgi:hypothetical protein
LLPWAGSLKAGGGDGGGGCGSDGWLAQSHLNDIRVNSRTVFSFLLIFTYILLRFTVIFPVVLYGHEVWSLILREEHRLRVFENRVLKGTM